MKKYTLTYTFANGRDYPGYGYYYANSAWQAFAAMTGDYFNFEKVTAFEERDRVYITFFNGDRAILEPAERD